MKTDRDREFARRILSGRLATGAFLLGVLTLAAAPQGGHSAHTTGGRRVLRHEPVLPEAPPETPLAAPGRKGSCGDPDRGLPDVHLHSGEFHTSAVDLAIPGRGLDLVWARTYRSRLGRDTAMGYGWDFSYDLRVEAVGQDVRLYDGNGRADLYRHQVDGTYVAPQFFREGVFEPDGSFTLRFADMGRWSFRPLDASPLAGRIQSISDRNANTISFAYEAGTGKLLAITDTLGRVVTVAWSGNRIASVTDFAGRTVAYAYYQPSDAGGNPGDLKSARSPLVTGTPNGNDFPLGKTTIYTYSTGFADERLNHNLLAITDPRGNAWLANEYGTADVAGELRFDRLLRQRRGSATDTIELVYVPIAAAAVGDPEPPTLRAILNDRVGNVREYFYDREARLVAKRAFTGRADPSLPTTATANRPANPLRSGDPPYFEIRYLHDANALTREITHPNGNLTRRVYELEVDPAAPQTTQGNLRELWRLPGTHAPAGDQPGGVVQRYEYFGGFGGCCGTSFVSRHTDARGNVTEHDYDAFGNRIETRHRTGGGVEDWTYDAFGRETSHTLADDGSGYRRRDERHWYGPADGAQNGYLREEVVDAANLALATRFAYDAVGNATSVTDPRGNDTQFLYNALNQVVRKRSRQLSGSPSFRIDTLNFYDANDNVTRVDVENRNELGTLDAANPAISTEQDYGILNEVLRERREVAAGLFVTTEFAYDANRNRTLVRKGEAFAGRQPANVVETRYDERDLVWRVIRATGDPAQSTDQRDYDGNGNVVARHEGLEAGEHVTTYAYDGLDRPVLATDPMGNTTASHYDPNGNPGGHTGNDASPLHLFATQILGGLLDGAGSAGNVRLSETMYAYDAMDRRIREDVRHFDTQTQAPILDGQSTRTWTLAPNSLLRSQSEDMPGHVLSYDYDTASRLLRSIDARGDTTTTSYDANSNPTTVVESDLSDLGGAADLFTTTYSYDALDRLVTKTDNVGNLVRLAYDSRGNLVLDTDPLLQRTRYVYDGLDRLTETRRDMNGNGGFNDVPDIILRETWDDSSRKTSETDDESHITRYAYDALDRRIVTQYADGTIDQVGSGATWTLGQMQPNLGAFASGYDAHDTILRRTDANGTRTDSAYDGLDRVLQRTITRASGVLGTTLETYQYDGLSRLVRAQDDDSLVVRGSSTTSGYDSLSNVLRETQQVLPAGPQRTVIAEYDGVSNATQLVYPGGRTIARTYDALDRPLQVNDVPPSGTPIATYQYAGPSRLARRTYGNGIRTEFTYDGITGIPNPPGDMGVQRVIRTRHATFPGGVVVDERANTWNRDGDRTVAQDQTTFPYVTQSYQYDAMDRLVLSSSSNYTLNGAGDRTFVAGSIDPGSYTLNAVHEYLTTPFDARTYDADGNVRTMTNPSRTLAYDYRNQLVQFVDTSTSQTTSYRYDCLGRRIEKATSGTTTRSYFDGAEEIEEQSQAGATIATYVHSKGEHSLLQTVRGGAAYFFHEDDVHNVVKLTNASGSVVESYQYGDFGKPTVTTPGAPGSFSQPPSQSGMQDSDLDGGSGSYSLILADSFMLAQTMQLLEVRWWGAYNSSPPATDDFRIEVHADNGGQPGATIGQWNVGNAVARTATGLLIVGFYPEYEYHASLSPTVQLSAGIPYWISIYGNTVGDPGSWRWEQSSSGDGQCAYDYNGSGWSPMGGDLAFELQLSSSAPPIGNPFLFGGRRYDAETGFALQGGRVLDCRSGRFLQRDDDDWRHSLVEIGNPFTFAANNPLSWAGQDRQEPFPNPPIEGVTEGFDKTLEMTRAVREEVQFQEYWMSTYRFPDLPCQDTPIFVHAFSKRSERRAGTSGLVPVLGGLFREIAAVKEARARWHERASANCRSACLSEVCDGPPLACQSTGYSGEPAVYEQHVIPGYRVRVQLYVAYYRDPNDPPPPPVYEWHWRPAIHVVTAKGYATCHCGCGLVGSRAGGYLTSD